MNTQNETTNPNAALIDVLTVAKIGKPWELEMLTDCEFDWSTAAAALLNKRASDLVLNNLSNDDLMRIACQQVDVNELYRKINIK